MGKNSEKSFDVIIVGGSYAGLSAAMSLGRSLRNVLVIDNGDPCNKQTPRSHNFITQDGRRASDIAAQAKLQVKKYDTIKFLNGLVISASKEKDSFVIQQESGEQFYAKKLLFASGIKDVMPKIKGFADCWGISILHCPYCHGYEVKNEEIAILANGSAGFSLTKLIHHWSTNITLFTHGKSTLNSEQKKKLQEYSIAIIEKEISHFENEDGHLKKIIFKDGSYQPMTVAFARVDFEQKSNIPKQIGCEITEHGFIKTDEMQKTTVPGIYAAGDNSYGLRAVSIAVAAGTKVGVFINHELINEEF